MERMTVREFFTLCFVNIRFSFYHLKELIKTVIHYYGNWQFVKTDISLILMYLFHNPFSISKRFLMSRGEKEIYAYGETPLTSMEIIAKEAKIGPNDHVFELGFGRGRTCFWLNSFCGCKVTGIEYIPEFVERANRIKNKLHLKGIEFLCEDMLDADYTEATVCYLFGTCLDDQAIERLVDKFSRLPSGTKIITVSYPLTDYTDRSVFEVMKRFTVPFAWGDTDVFLHLVKK